MKSYIILFVMAVSLAMCPSEAMSETVSFLLQFSSDEFTFEKSSDLLSIGCDNSDYGYGENPNNPGLPVKCVHVPFEKTCNYVSADVQVIQKTKLYSNVMLSPNPVEVPTETPLTEPSTVTKPDYGDGTFPLSTVVFMGLTKMDESSIMHFQLCPFEYCAESGDLYIIDSLLLNLDISNKLDLNESLSLNNYNPEMKESMRCCVNVEDETSTGYTFATEKNVIPDIGCIDYLIITNEALRDSFEIIRTLKTAKGLRVQIVTTEQIATDYIGSDIQEKTKMCIKKLCAEKGLKYVLLGGDNTVVPARMCKVVYSNYSDTTPADLYYACFGGAFNWDGNGNVIYGEVDDEIDFSSSVFISRLPVRTAADVIMYGRRLVAYELGKTNFNNKMLHVGVSLFNGVGADGQSDAYKKGEKFYNSYIAPYWNGQRDCFFDTYTDFLGGDNFDVSSENLQAKLSDGYDFVDILTHGSSSSFQMEVTPNFSVSNASSISDQTPKLITTMACFTNAFDAGTDPCLSEAFIRGKASILGYLGSSRYGWGNRGMTTLGSSLQYEAKYYENLFDNNVVYKNFAKLVSTAKTSMIPLCGTNSTYRWLQFSLNSIGDPEMYVYTETPKTISYPILEFTQGTLVVETSTPGCDISVISYRDLGDTLFECIKDANCFKVTNIDCDILVSITKPGYKPVTIKGTIKKGSTLTINPKMTFETFTFQSLQPLSMESQDSNFISVETGYSSITVSAFIASHVTESKLILYDIYGNYICQQLMDITEYSVKSISGINPGMYVLVLQNDGAVLDRISVMVR